MGSTDLPLEILHQDDWLVAINKPAGHLVHPADIPQNGDLVAMKILRDQLGQLVYNVHRLDRPTTGVLLFGTDRDAARALHRAFARHEIQKTYLAIVSGAAPPEPWECKEPLQKTSDAPVRDAHTSFTPIRAFNHPALSTPVGPTLALLKATPHTGRYHQIRRHLAHSGFPIIGDYRYAGIKQSDLLGNLLGTGTRMLLQSSNLTFTHPVTEAITTITAPPDPAFLKVFPEIPL